MSEEVLYPPGLEWLLGEGTASEASIRQRLVGFGKGQLIGIILQLLAWIAGLRAEKKDLRAQLSQNSRNSSRPPASDGYKKPAPKSLRQKSGRKRGGQPGHPGSTLEMVKEADHYVLCPLPEKCGCGRDLSLAQVSDVERRQLFDLPPPPKLEVTEFQAQTKVCSCGRLHTAPFPSHVTQPTQYGPGVQARVLYLNQYQLVPYERTQEALHDLFGVDLSQGTIKNILHRGYRELAPFEGRLTALLIMMGVVHFDESGMRVLKDRYWVHVACTERYTFYYMDAQRGEPAMQNMAILPRFAGKAVHDHWASYFTYEGCAHVLCNAHHLRELVYAHEQYQQSWAQALIECLLEANAEVIAAKAQGLTALPEKRLDYFSHRYSRILREGRQELPVLPPAPKKRGRVKQHKVKNLHDRLRDFKQETLAFLYDFSAPFTNNQGERDIRMAKIKQKISGCFRSLLGAQMFARARSYISTAKKQRFNPLEALTALFTADERFIRRLTEPP